MNAGDAAVVLATIRSSLTDTDLQAYVVTVDGRVVGLDAAPPVPSGTFVIDPLNGHPLEAVCHEAPGGAKPAKKAAKPKAKAPAKKPARKAKKR